MSIDEQIKHLIEDRILKLRSHDGKIFFAHNLDYPEDQKNKELAQIQIEIKKLEPIHTEVARRIKNLKELIPDITEQNSLTAIYLVYGKILQTMEAIFLLSTRGHNFTVMELIRSVGENTDLIKVFLFDREEKYLQKWFEGKIIHHRISRELIDKFIVESDIQSIKESGLSAEKLASDVYSGFSKYTHCSYAALLDCVDVFNEDFDWNGYAGTHYTLHNIHALKSAIRDILITLKHTYLNLKDFHNCLEIDQILLNFAGPMNEDTLEDLIANIAEDSK